MQTYCLSKLSFSWNRGNDNREEIENENSSAHRSPGTDRAIKGDGMKDKSEWISVKDRMPKRDVDIVALLDWGGYEIGRLEKDPDNLEWRWSFEYYDLYGEEFQKVTHWLPLPELPGEKDK